MSSTVHDRYSSIIDVHLILLKDGRILLGQRKNTGFGDGKFHLPAGHLEQGETVVSAVVREAREELGIVIESENVNLGLVLHQKSNDGRLGLFFVVDQWSGTLNNMEPDKCRKLLWFDLDGLPSNMIPYARFAIQQYRSGRAFALYGWSSDFERPRTQSTPSNTGLYASS